MQPDQLAGRARPIGPPGSLALTSRLFLAGGAPPAQSEADQRRTQHRGQPIKSEAHWVDGLGAESATREAGGAGAMVV